MAEFFQLLVYCSEHALGNPTGVVFLDHELANEEYLRIAASLALPDTAFLFPADRDGRVPVRVFSPVEELSLCTQALIAAHRVLESRTGDQKTRFLTLADEVPVASRGDIAWLTGSYWLEDRQFSQEIIPSLRAARIDSGRVRAFFEMPDTGSVAAVRLRPEEVLAWCRAEALHGICPVAQTGERSAFLRVFTTSQGGREDIATGGACLGIPAFFGESSDAEWRIEQGFGESRRRGTLFAKRLSDSTAAVGGRHRLVARGELDVTKDSR